MTLNQPAACPDFERTLVAIGDKIQQTLDGNTDHALFLKVDDRGFGTRHGADGQVIDANERRRCHPGRVCRVSRVPAAS